jgi:citrate/tricarballylate utilization protein
LAIHLGVGWALFVSMPWGKFVHGLYRAAALLRAARERGEEEAAAKKEKPRPGFAGVGAT